MRSFQFPALVADVGPEASKSFFEFFTLPIHNKNTGITYHHAIGGFLASCERAGKHRWASGILSVFKRAVPLRVPEIMASIADVAEPFSRRERTLIGFVIYFFTSPSRSTIRCSFGSGTSNGVFSQRTSHRLKRVAKRLITYVHLLSLMIASQSRGGAER